MSGSRRLLVIFGLPVALLLLIQVVPYGRDHTKPAAGSPIAWDSPATQQLAKRACFDCHSNETRWPWYASIAPFSWRIQHHVTEGREVLNFSAFDPANEKTSEAAGESGETVEKGKMPPWDYLLMHPEARLTAAEKQALVAEFDAKFAAYTESGGDGVPGRKLQEGAKAVTNEREKGEEDEKDERHGEGGE